MNTRSIEILKKLCGDKTYMVEDLAHDFEISERMVRYVIDDINDFLGTIGISKIMITRNQWIRLDMNQDDYNLLNQEISNLDNYVYTTNSQERRNYILISMWCHQQPLTSQFFADILNVSKSSIDKDILSIRQEYSEYDFSINVKSGKGSYIEGDERDIRDCFYRVIEKNVDFDKVLHFIDQPLSFIEKSIYQMVFEKYINSIIQVLTSVEEKSDKKLTYLSYKDLCIHLVVALTRIELGYSIHLHSQYLLEISKTEGYQEAQDICQQLMEKLTIEITESEVAFITVVLNSARYTTLKRYIIHDWANIQMIATSLVLNVGKKLSVDFSQDEELINSLALHLGPTIFKIQNHVPVVNPSLMIIKKSYQDVFAALLESFKELNYGELEGIQEDDIAFLTLHFCAALERKKRFKEVYNVVIVCVHGVGTASLMKEMICSRFKNIIVKKTMTREHLSSDDLKQIDFIISSIDIPKTTCPVIKVNVILKESDYRLIETVMQNIVHHNEDNKNSYTYGILDIINENCEVIDKEALIESLTNYFQELGIHIKRNIQPSLKDFLSVDKIAIFQSIDTWEKAVQVSGNILVNSKDIEQCYIESMISTVNNAGAYMVIDQGIALIHGEMNYGVNHTSMSLLMVRDGVKFHHNEYDPVYIILCLAAKDNYTHIQALNHFIQFLNNVKKNGIEHYFHKEYVLNQIEEVSQYD